jgi:hypothetical protein
MSEEPNHTFYDRDRKRRVIVSPLGDGCYTFEEEAFSDDPFEMCWIPLTGGRSYPICESYDIALREARGRVAWLAELSGCDHPTT